MSEKNIISESSNLKKINHNPEEVNLSAFDSIKKKEAHPLREFSNVMTMMSLVSNIGFTMIGCIITGLFAGIAFEKYIVKETNAVYVVIGALLGVISGFFTVYRHILKKIIK